jgi:uncharacterized protein YoxC
MSDTWAAVLAISIAVQTLVQVGVLAGLVIAIRRMTATVSAAQVKVESLVEDVQGKVNLVVGDVRDVTSKVNAVAGSVRDGVQRVEDSIRSTGQRVADAGHRVEQTVRNASQRVATAVDQVPRPVKQGVPAALAVITAYRTFRQVQNRIREKQAREALDDMNVAS